MKRRVVVTGIGAISAAGSNTEQFVSALRVGKRCFTTLDDPRLEELGSTHAGLISGFGASPDDPAEVRSLDRNVHLSLVALREALFNAGYSGEPLGPRAAVVLGTCSGGMLSIERHYEALLRGEDPLDEDLFFSKRYHTASKVLAWAAGASGPALTISTACAAGTGAIVQGVDLIRAGLADVALVGGSDAFAPSTLAGFDALKATCKGMCAPFSLNIGLNLGEGAAFFVIEGLDHAEKRGAKIAAELLGCGLSNDAYHPTAPDPTSKGQVTAMERALEDAGAVPDNIDYINAHGTGTRANDPAESRAIGRLLGDRAGQVPVSSTKSMIGHCLGAAGALEASATILAARNGFLPPTAGFDGAREGCNLGDYVPKAGRAWRGRIALTNSFGFGGNNACLVIDTFPEIEQPVTNLPEAKNVQSVITGLGSVSPLGVGLERLRSSTGSGIARVDRFETPAQQFTAGLVPHIDAREVDRRLDLKGMDLCSKYAALSARSALKNAGLKPRPTTMAGVGMILGLATGPSQGESDHLGAIYRSGFRLDRLGGFPYIVPNEVTGHVARVLMLKGHNTVLSTGQGAGLAALISAAIAVEQGHSDTILAVAADEITERTASDGHRLGRWGPGTGVAPGEGAATLVVENRDAASSRGTEVLARISGYAMATDVEDPRGGDGEALARALLEALERAGIKPDDCEHLTSSRSSPKTDDIEQRAFDRVFGKRSVPPFSLTDRIGLAEATLPLFNLSYLIATSSAGTNVAAAFYSPEGYAGALIISG
ncbi:MAG: hypothetical protein GY854_30590 [Deltaproteobacteria bacterium]|nr:hypothetical protein [Deltaproteobacteria bacterium]